eukprot:TRINITY_DN8050_c0_g1_i1.p1 TRINITY_DN8050_c0_g1~~TRINITY_DN8050_c0_g1_i1.p1  ORF type:complete len:385 (-),score=103.50 TRINITY_DN8050_c0_g1_i1:55-1209(-)
MRRIVTRTARSKRTVRSSGRYYNPNSFRVSYATTRSGDRTTPTTPPPVAGRPNETLTQPQPSHANERDNLSHQFGDMYNVVKPKLKTSAQLNTQSFGKRSRNADESLSAAKRNTSAFIPSDKAQRFARDLYMTAVQYDGQPSLLLEDLNKFSNQVKTDSYLNQMFKSSLTPANVRRSALQKFISENQFKSTLTPEALRVLSDLKALGLIGTVSSSLQRLSDLNNKKIDVNVTLAEDSESERKRVTEQLRNMIGNQAQATFNFKVDPDLISGIRAETMGQLLIDTSGRKGLEDEASKYMSRLDEEISRLKRIRNERNSGYDAQSIGKREWSELMQEVNRLNQVPSTTGQSGQKASGSQSGADSTEEDNDRMKALTEIYRFKRSRN